MDESKLDEGTRAIVTTRGGKTFLAVWTLAPGIDFYWKPVMSHVTTQYISDPVVRFEVV